MMVKRKRILIVSIVVIALAAGCAAILLSLSNRVASFTVVAGSSEQAASPLAAWISQAMFVAMAATVVAVLGWLCYRRIKRPKD